MDTHKDLYICNMLDLFRSILEVNTDFSFSLMEESIS
jgi:hypothetical protein